MKKQLVYPSFLFGFGIRLLLIFLVLPHAVTSWYVPFLEVSIQEFTFDPWAVWLDKGGKLAAFPYGYSMWLAFLPLTLVCDFFDLPLHFGYAITLLAVDFSLMVVLRKLLPVGKSFLLIVYWLSPIVLIATYILGLNDLVPIFLLVLSLYFIRQLKLFWAGVFCVLAISAKLSMVLALPFFVIYFLHSRALHRLIIQFLAGTFIAIVVVGFPFLFSSAALKMLLSNLEMNNIYQFSFSVHDGILVYVVPLAYLLMICGAWQVRRMNFELFQSVLGMTFLAIVLLMPASPGWFIWALPLLVIQPAMNSRIPIMLSAIFSVLYVFNTLFAFISTQFGFHADLAKVAFEPHLGSLFHTAMFAIGIVLMLQMWREAVSRNDYFRLSRTPFVIGIAGDSGSGKDTLVNALEGLFGGHSVVKLSGDDYHLWDRAKPIWQVMTHLNPMANDLQRFADDLVSLMDRKSVTLRRYDHKIGLKSELIRLKSNDFIIASGLHSLYLPILRDCFNLSIYLDMDEGLRRYLKKSRDIKQRGHSVNDVLSSLAKRELDSEKFIRPQAAHADLVLSIRPNHPCFLDGLDVKSQLRLKLLVRSRNGLNQLSLVRVLVGVCGLHVDIETSMDSSLVELTIEGEVSADDVALAAEMLCPRVLDFLDIMPNWEGGVLGLMQLVILSQINQALTKRFL